MIQDTYSRNRYLIHVKHRFWCLQTETAWNKFILQDLDNNSKYILYLLFKFTGQRRMLHEASYHFCKIPTEYAACLQLLNYSLIQYTCRMQILHNSDRRLYLMILTDSPWNRLIMTDSPWNRQITMILQDSAWYILSNIQYTHSTLKPQMMSVTMVMPGTRDLR